MTLAVSVVIPTFRSARFVTDALDGVRAQTTPVAAIVVVDDGSDDDTVAAVETWSRATGVPVALRRQANAGSGAARRVGLSLVTTDAVAFLDADDVWRPEAIERLSAVLDAHPDALVVYGAMEPFADGSLPAAEVERRTMMSNGAALLFSASLVRRAAFDRIGPFADGNFSGIDWFARLVEVGPGASVALDDVVARRRIHAANTSFITERPTLKYAEAIKASLDRRRARGEIS